MRRSSSSSGRRSIWKVSATQCGVSRRCCKCPAPVSTNSGFRSSPRPTDVTYGSRPIAAVYFAETLTAFLLRLRGQRIVAQRYKTPVGEIDLVALRGRRLAFIEVMAEERGYRLDLASQATLPHRASRAILAGWPPGLCRA